MLAAPMKKATDSDPIAMDELRQLARARFGDMVKAVVDLRRAVMLVDAEMHADQEAELLGEGSAQRDLWGIKPLSRYGRGRLAGVRFHDQSPSLDRQSVPWCR